MTKEEFLNKKKFKKNYYITSKQPEEIMFLRQIELGFP
jgi:hypothetical protein